MTKITNLNEILSDWAYRVDGGMPDATKLSHLVILEKTLIECGWNVAERYEFIKNLQEAARKPNKDGYIHKSQGVYVKAGDEDKENPTKYKKTDDGKYVPAKEQPGKKEKGAVFDKPGDEERKLGDKEPEDKPKEDPKAAEKEKQRLEKRKKKDEELLNSIEDSDEPGELWTLEGKPKKWVMKKTKRTRRENAEEVIRLKNNLEDAMLSGDEEAQIKALKELADSGLVSLNAPGVDTKKLYIGTIGSSGRKKAGEGSGKDTGRIDPATGLPYLKFGNNNTFAKKVHELLEKHGKSEGIEFPYQGDKTGKKRMNPDNLFRLQAKEGEKAPTQKVEITKTDTGVRIGNFAMDTIGPDFVEKETARMRKAGVSESDIELYKKTVNLHNKKVKAFQEAIDNGEDLEVFEILGDDAEVLDPAKEEDRRKMPLQIVKMLGKKYEQLLGKDMSDEVKSSLNDLQQAAEDFANGKDPDGSKFRKAQERFFEVIDTDSETRPSVSDVAEILALAEDLSRGRYAVLPSKSNFAVGDVLSANMRAANIGGNTAEEINESLKILFVTAKGLTSVKYAKGGSSQSSNKIEGTDYKPYKNKKGKVTSSEEIKKDLMELSTLSYDELWSFEKTEQAEARTNEIQEKHDIKDCPPEPFKGKTADADAHAAGYLYADCSEAAVAKREKAWMTRASGAKGIKKVEDCPELDKAIPRKKDDGTPYSESERLQMARKKMVETYKQQERAGRTMQIVNNRQMETQTWTNRVYEVLTPAAAKKAGREEGESRFNKKETNGITVLGGMDFTENPGYDGPCGKPINKMASGITTVKKD